MKISTCQIRQLARLLPEEHRVEFKSIFSTAFQRANVTMDCCMKATGESGVVAVYHHPKGSAEMKIGIIRIRDYRVSFCDERYHISFESNQLYVARYKFE